jgi:hypothetical protein
MNEKAAPLLDMAHLRKRTMDDAGLQVEMLSLFVAEVERLLVQAERADNPQLRADRIGAIASLARNIGAAQLAQVARGMEQPADDASPPTPVDLSALRSAVMTTVAFIRRDAG